MPDARGGLKEYLCAAQHELAIARGGLRTFASAIGFLIDAKTARLAAILDTYVRGPYANRAWVTVTNENS